MKKRILIAGITASVAMAMVEMIYEGLFGVGFWSAPVFIAATVLRDLQTIALPVVFLAVPVIVGLMGHMMNSVLLGFIFVTIFSRFTTARATSVLAGMGYALIVFLFMWFIVLPLIDPVMRNINPYMFALAHLVWGATLGWFVAKHA